MPADDSTPADLAARRPEGSAVNLAPRPDEAHVSRAQHEEVVSALLGATRGEEATVALTTALQGAGGFGKTALAQAACWDPRVRAAFPAGILWVEMGQALTAAGQLVRLRDLIRAWTGGEPPPFETLAAAAAHLRKLLDGRRVLVVVDDVWSPEALEPFAGLAAGSALLATTRVRSAVPAGSVAVEVAEMSASEAEALLARGLPGVEAAARGRLSRLAVDRLGRWPLLLGLVNRQIRARMATGLSLDESLAEVEEALASAGLEAFDREDVESRKEAVASTLDASARLLDPGERRAFHRLAILPEDADVPVHVLAVLWEVPPAEAEKLCHRFYEDLSLLRRYDPGTATARLHQVVRSYLVRLQERELPERHRRFLRSWRPRTGRWSDLPRDEGYLWRHLAHHLRGAGSLGELETLLSDFNFLQAKLAAAGANALLADFAGFPRNAALRRIAGAIRLSAHVLQSDEAQLRGQLWGRLPQRVDPQVERLLRGAQAWPGGPWLRSRLPSLASPWGPLVRILDAAWATALAPLGGRQVASNAWNGDLRIWDLDRGEIVATFEGHALPITALAASPSGQVVVSACSSGAVRVWDLPGGESFDLPERQGGEVTALLCLDERRFLTAGSDGTVRRLDLEERRYTRVFEGHAEGVASLTLLGRGRAVSVAEDGMIRILDVEGGTSRPILLGRTERISIAVGLGDRHLLTGTRDGLVRLWDLGPAAARPATLVKTFELPGGGVTALAALERGRAFAAAEDGRVHLLETRSAEPPLLLGSHAEAVTAFAVLPGGWVVSSARDETFRVWDPESAEWEEEPGEHDGMKDITPLGAGALASGSLDGILYRWDPETGRRTSSLEAAPGEIAVLEPVGQHRVVVSSLEGIATHWDLESGTRLATGKVPGDWITALATCAGKVALGTAGGQMRLWDLATGELISLQEADDWILELQARDADRILGLSPDGVLWQWDLSPSPSLRSIDLGEKINCLAVRDRSRLVLGGRGGALLAYDLDAGGEPRQLGKLDSEISALALWQGEVVLTGGKDGSLVLWSPHRDPIGLHRLDAPVAKIAVFLETRSVVVLDSSGRMHFLVLEEVYH